MLNKFIKTVRSSDGINSAVAEIKKLLELSTYTKPLVITIQPQIKKRTTWQNSYLWTAVRFLEPP